MKALEALQKSTNSTYHEIYQEHYHKVYATALAVLRQVEDAEDVTQEVFRTLWHKGDAFVPGKGKFSTWLTTMARNRAIDCLRSRQRRGRVVETCEELPAPSPDFQQPAHGSDQAARQEDYTVMKEALKRLPEAQRKALVLTFFEGRTHVEIAVKLGQPLGTVKARVRRGLLKLREMLRVQIPGCPAAG